MISQQRSDLADRISLRLLGTSEIYSLGLGIILGGLLLSAFQHARHRRASQPGRDVETTAIRDHCRKASTVWPSTTLPEMAQNITSAAEPPQANTEDVDSQLSILRSSISPSHLGDLPPPLRTTLYESRSGVRPWTSADFAYYSNTTSSIPNSSWKKRHTMPAMHITDHVRYFPSSSEQPDGSTPTDGADVDGSASRSEDTSRKWCRRRILTFEPLLPRPSLTQEPDRAGASSTEDLPGMRSPLASEQEAPMTVLEVEIEQQELPRPNISRMPS